MPADLVTRLLLQNQEFDRNLKASQNQIKTFQKRVDAMGSSVRNFVGGFAGMAGISFAFMDIAQKSIQFEKSLSSLRSLTGVSAEELSFFKDEAIKLGSTSTQTASQVVEAFQLIGSQKPELLKNKDALAEVTKSAITLAEAAGMDVPEAAKALTGSLNQMGESSQKAGEYINILAAASQAGSANIPYLTKAIEKSGGAASSVGIKYNELVAAIEAIAPKITEASEAGTNLRNIFLVLESSSDKNLKPSVVGLSKAIENLAAKNMDATQMTKMFGRESVTAALALVSAKDQYNHYVDAITGTNTAIEQQKINNDNLAGSINGVSSAWEGFVLTLNNSNGALKDAADILTVILGRMTEAMKSETQKQNELIREGVADRKKSLSQEIEGWMVLGDRKKAIEETMRQFSLRNSGGESREELNVARDRLNQLQKSLRKMNKKQEIGHSPLDVLGRQLTGLPNTSTSYGDVVAKKSLEEEVQAQQEIVNKLEIKNQLYKESIQFLNDELKATEKINKAPTPNNGAPVVTDEMRKQWRFDDVSAKLNLKIENDIQAQIQEKVNTEPVKITVVPEYIESEETSDISGSVEDYQQRIQSVTLAYNEATTDGLRAMYAKQREDLEKHLEEMTDMNQGMIDISNELQSLIQSGVVSGFESLGEAIGSGDPGEAMRNMLMGLMDMLKQFGAALVAAGMAKIAFDKLLVNPFAAIAAGGALIIATSAAKSALQKSVSTGDYAEGGLAPYFTVGDRMTENINGGEMILNTSQQAKLFDLLDLGRSQIENDHLEVTGRLVGEGSNLYAVLDTYAKKQRRGKYFHEFKGLDEVSNRFEIMCNSSTTPKLIEATNDPFRIEYIEVKKLEPVQGSQATLRLISESNFQFLDLHTDDMQGYMVKFYRSGQLYWIGYLDSELYNENLTDYAPYAVEFSGADFNILERLKFRDESEKNYTDIASFMTQLKRCFNKLGLPFQKLYIGCSTIPKGVTMTTAETALHVLYIQSSNFYDEDGEPMSCREVIESILQPFGLMMVQRDASVYVYDLNIVKSGGVMKCYNFDTLSYIGDTAVDVQLGDIGEIGTMSTEASLGFEEMINNTTITSSLYADKDLLKASISEKTLSEKKKDTETGDKYKVEYYAKDENVEALNGRDFIVYTNTDSDATMIGASLPYDPYAEKKLVQYKVKNSKVYITGDTNYYINVKVQAYANTRTNPFNSEENPPGDISRAKALWLHCNLYLVDSNGTPIRYYSNQYPLTGWWPSGEIVPQGLFELFYADTDVWNGNPLNTWMTNSDIALRSALGQGYPTHILDKNHGVGQNVQLHSVLNGYVVFEIVNSCEVDHPGGGGYPYDGVKNILINDISLSIKDKNKDDISTDDYEFKSYINKKVAADYDDVTLKCISANEEKLPVGKANILKKVDDHYELQLSYSRSGQTDILERLLMCTIHSNFTTKNKVISVDIKMTENPALRYVTYDNVLQSDGMYITGATLDFHNAKTTIKAVEFSADVDKLSDIPYD